MKRSFLLAATCFAVACTQAQLKTASNVDATALTDTAKACIALEAASAVEPVTVPYVMGACGLATGVESLVGDFLNVLAGQKAALAARRMAAYRKAAVK